MNLSRQDGPIYLQIAATLRAELPSYAPGDYLPGELSLARRFGVNRHTVRSALGVLEQEACVIRIKGKGTQVLGAPLRYPLAELSAFSDWFGGTGHEVRSRLLGTQVRAARDNERQYLGLAPEAQVVEIRTQRFIGDEAINLMSHCFSVRYQDQLEGYRSGSMRQHLRKQGLSLTRAFSVIGARLPNVNEAARLSMSVTRPVLVVETVSKDPEGTPVELTVTVSRADRFQYHVVI